MKRDKTLDILRGVGIMQVVFVHALYWLSIFETGFLAVFKSFFLFEMPIFFFVTGAVNNSAKYNGYWNYCKKRIKGILIPYYVYAVFCILILTAFYFIKNELSFTLMLKVAVSWLIPIDRQIMPLSYFTWAIWFVPVYILAIAFFPAVKKACAKLGKWTLLLLVSVFLVTEAVNTVIVDNTVLSGVFELVYTLLDILQKTAFYLIFMCLGVFYPEWKQNAKRNIKASAIILALSAVGVGIFGNMFGGTLDMQINKFPPNHVFLLYSIAVMCLIYIVYAIGKGFYNSVAKRLPMLEKMILYFSQNSVYVFLYQSFAFFVITAFIKVIGITGDWLIFVITLLSVYPLIWIGLKILNYFLSKIKSINKKIRN